MESYLDDKADNRWLKVTDLTDNGRWYANPDSYFTVQIAERPKTT